MKKSKGGEKVSPTYFSMRMNAALHRRLIDASDYEERNKTDIVSDAIEFYLAPAEAQRRFEILSNSTATSTQGQINSAINLLVAWIEEVREDAKNSITWMGQAKENIETICMSLGTEVLELRRENKQLKSMIEEISSQIGGSMNGGGGAYQRRPNQISNPANPPPQRLNPVNQSAPD